METGLKCFILFCFLIFLVLDLSWKSDLLAYIDRTCLILVMLYWYREHQACTMLPFRRLCKTYSLNKVLVWIHVHSALDDRTPNQLFGKLPSPYNLGCTFLIRYRSYLDSWSGGFAYLGTSICTCMYIYTNLYTPCNIAR